MTGGASKLFPLLIVIASVAALFHPPVFTWFSGQLIPLGLGFIMLGMGLTLTIEDFKRIRRMPSNVGAGILLQYSFMPLLGWLFGQLFGLPTGYAVGLSLVSCCPGGTASNVISYT